MKSSENFIVSLNRYLNICSMLGIVLGTGDTAVDKTDLFPILTAYRLNAVQVHCSDYLLPPILDCGF